MVDEDKNENIDPDDPLFIRMKKSEKDVIRELAASSGMSVSQYVKSVSSGYKPITLIESGKVKEILKVNADLARLGNLLKAWIFNDVKYQISFRMKIESKLDESLNKVDDLRGKIDFLVDEILKDMGKKYKP